MSRERRSVVPNWNNIQRHAQDKNKSKEEKRGTDPHTCTTMHMQQQNHPNTNRLVPLSNYDVTELRLENGQLAKHGLGSIFPTAGAQAKPTWGRTSDTLESIVHQATNNKREPNFIHHDQTPADISSMVASSGGTLTNDTSQVQLAEGWMRKRTRLDSDYCGNNFSSTNTRNINEEHADPSTTCASPSASARLCRDNETTVTTWASFESLPSLKTKSIDEDSASHGRLENQDDGQETTKDGESGGSARPRRAAAVHNQSERRRRDRINQKMKALQRLVPNANKTDKASMLDEVIKYLEQLQAQVQIMNSLRNMSHMMNMNMMNMNMNMPPLGMEQQQNLHQMSILAHMGMGGNIGPIGLGMGMGMLDMCNMARIGMHPPAHHQSLSRVHPTAVVAAAAPPTFVPPFMMPPHPTAHHQPKPEPAGTNNASDPYCALVAQQQSMNMELFNRMAALYRQQVNQTTTPAATGGSPSQSNRVREGTKK